MIQPIRVPDCVVEQTVDIPSPKIQEHIVEVMKVIRFMEERRRRIFEKCTEVQKLKGAKEAEERRLEEEKELERQRAEEARWREEEETRKRQEAEAHQCETEEKKRVEQERAAQKKLDAWWLEHNIKDLEWLSYSVLNMEHCLCDKDWNENCGA